MELPYFSVIIPVYQAEKTIERCISSIISNKHKIEIICIDDGSTDSSPIILDEISRKDERVRVVHQINEGAGPARNRGLKEALGKYIMFCDADDTYLADTIDLIADDTEKYNPDYIVFHRRTVMLDGHIQYVGTDNEQCGMIAESFDKYLNDFFYKDAHCYSVINKVFRKAIIVKNDIKFEDFKFGEDLWFVLTYAIKAKTFFEDYRAYYQQYQTDGSLCMTSYSNHYELNSMCIRQFQTEYSNECKLLIPFIEQTKYSLVQSSLYRILHGIDARGFLNKRQMFLSLCSKNEIAEFLSLYLSNNSSDSSVKRDCNEIINKEFLLFAFRHYYYPLLKKKLKSLLKLGHKKVLCQQ